MSDDTTQLRDGDPSEIDLRDDVDLQDRLRFAAGSLAADFDGVLTIDVAEELVFNSAEGLLAAASVTDFVPILAERRARRVVRSAASEGPMPPPAVASPAPPSPPPAPTTGPPPPAPAATAEPLFAIPDEALTRLRDGVAQARKRVAELTAR